MAEPGMRVLTVVGARPQFIKAAVVSHALEDAGVEEQIVHTGQHYDEALSRVFFEELGIPEPAFNLGVGSGPHGGQTGEMMRGLEALILDGLQPDWLLVYGDTNSTLAGALVAAKLHLPLAHVEAGLRSFNRRMPEEVNRVLTDHVSDLLLCPTETAVENLQREGITRGVVRCGDVMLDATRFFAKRASERPLRYEQGEYYLATVHRAENTDWPERLRAIFHGFGRLDATVVLPLHPRTRRSLDGITVPPNVELIEPVGYLDMLNLTRGARAVLTDSGGLQKEAYWLGRQCVTLRDETEWIETLAGGWNRLVGVDPDAIERAALTPPHASQEAFGGPVREGSPVKMIVASLIAHPQDGKQRAVDVGKSLT